MAYVQFPKEPQVKMNDPASALDLDLGELSDDEIMAQIVALRRARLSDVEKSRRSVAAKTVGKLTGTAIKIKYVSIEAQVAAQVKQLIKATGEAMAPEMEAKLVAKLVKQAKEQAEKKAAKNA